MSNNQNEKKFHVKDTRKYGKGVFSKNEMAKGEFIYRLKGKRLTLGQLVNRIVSGKEYIDDPFQIGRRTYVDLDEFSRTFNHSCNPNGGIRKTSELFALRDIKKGEELTYDYSMTISPTDWHMKCKCSTSICRKTLGDVRSVPKAQLKRYEAAGAVQRYMKPLLKELVKGRYKMPQYEVNALRRLEEKKT